MIPALANRWERINPLKMRFFLRQGVTFHNGEPFNASSVCFTVRKVLGSESRFPVKMMFPFFKAVTEEDPYTVVFETHMPDGLLLHKLGVYLKMLPPDYFDTAGEKGFMEKPVGTGPFVFNRWERGKYISLLSNEHYWMEGIPDKGIKEVRFCFVPMGDQIERLLSGELDLITDMPGIYTFQVATNKMTKVVKKESLCMFFAPLNNKKPPFSDVRVRKAVNLAIDKAKLIKYSVRGNGSPLASLTMPGEFGHNADLKPYPFNIKKARNLMKEAGYENGVTVEVACLVPARIGSEIMAAQLNKIGVRLNITFMNRQEIEETIHRANFDPEIPDWDGDMTIAYGPNGICHSLFLQDFACNSRIPTSIMLDRKIDAGLEAAKGETDLFLQETLCFELDKAVHDKALAIFGFQQIKTYGIGSHLEFTPHITGIPDLRSLKVK